MRPHFIRGVLWVLFWMQLASSVIPASGAEESSSKIQWGKEGDVPVPADYDGDGKDDIAIFQPSDGRWEIRGSDGKSWNEAWGQFGDLPVPRDYDGDGKVDVAVFRPSDETWHIRGSIGRSWTNQWGQAGIIPVPGDYDGDEKCDLAFFQPSDGKWHIQGSGGGRWSPTWGQTNDIPVPADYNGDGMFDAAVFRPKEGSWYLSVSGWTRWLVPAGKANDVPLPGDYNGDGKADSANWRQATSTFYITFTGGGNDTIHWGDPGDIPVPADYDGDGKKDVAIFRPRSGVWHIAHSATGRSTERLQFRSRAWQIQDGLPHNFVQAVLQTDDGYLCVGTAGGLARFDGIRVTEFPVGTSSNLATESIRFLHQTRDGTLWLVPDLGGLFHSKSGDILPDAFAGNSQIKALFESADGSLWIGTTNGLAQRKEGEWKWHVMESGLEETAVLALCDDRKGGLWLGTSRGLVHYSEDKFTIDHDQSKGPVRAVFCDENGSVWMGAGGGGVTHLSNGEFTYYEKNRGLLNGFVSTIFRDSRGELWVGTLGGLFRLAEKRFTPELDKDGKSFDAVLCMSEDSEGSLWVGTKQGLQQLRVKPFTVVGTQLDSAGNSVTSVLEDKWKNRWFATWGGGLKKMRGGKITTYSRANRPFYDVLLSLCESKEGGLWIGADFNGGLFRYKDGEFTSFSKEAGLIDPAIRVIHEDRQTNLWIGASGALYRMSGGKLSRFTTSDGLAGNINRAIYEDREGVLWIGSNQGLTRHQNGRFSTFIPKDGEAIGQVLSIRGDEDGSIWIGTDRGGLKRLRAGRITSYTSKQGLFSDQILEVIEDDYGFIWMSSVAGVFRIAKRDCDRFDAGSIPVIPCSVFGKEEGMESVQCNGVSKPAGWKDSEGRIWFPTTRGVVMVDPKAVSDRGAAPPVVMEKVAADGVIGWQNGLAAPTLSPVNIPAGRGELEFQYTALSFAAAERNRFKYQLERVDINWVDAGNRRVAHYSNLKPGRYTFRVQGCNSDGVWNDNGAEIKVILEPHFWQTTWFMVFIGLMTVGFVAGTARYVTRRKVHNQMQRFERQYAIERERSRIAQDMHDDLGARLTEVLMVGDHATRIQRKGGEVSDQLKRITHVARELIDNMDAIVWAVSPQNDTLDKLVLYISEFASTFLEPAGIRYRISAPNPVPNIPLSSEVRHHLFLVVKEALNNVVRHSGAKEVRISLLVEPAKMVLIIQDDGHGFVLDEVPGTGNGLQNMEKRIASVGGNSSIVSEQGKGTRIELSIPLGRNV